MHQSLCRNEVAASGIGVYVTVVWRLFFLLCRRRFTCLTPGFRRLFLFQGIRWSRHGVQGIDALIGHLLTSKSGDLAPFVFA